MVLVGSQCSRRFSLVFNVSLGSHRFSVVLSCCRMFSLVPSGCHRLSVHGSPRFS